MNLLPMNNPYTVNLGENIEYINKCLEKQEAESAEEETHNDVQ